MIAVPARTLFAPLCILCSHFLFAGCDRGPAADTAPTDIRGAPIAQAVTNSAPFKRPPTNPPANLKSEIANPKSTPAGPTPANFDILSGYAIEITDDLLGPVTNDLALVAEKTNALIPEPVRALTGKAVSIRGFMLPLKVDNGLVTELLVMKDQSMCCYGSTPKINEWVSVKMAKKGVRPLMDQPVTLFGTLHVGEMRENGYLTGIYRLDGERMEVPED